MNSFRASVFLFFLVIGVSYGVSGYIIVVHGGDKGQGRVRGSEENGDDFNEKTSGANGYTIVIHEGDEYKYGVGGAEDIGEKLRDVKYTTVVHGGDEGQRLIKSQEEIVVSELEGETIRDEKYTTVVHGGDEGQGLIKSQEEIEVSELEVYQCFHEINSCYKFGPVALKWLEARADCKRDGGDLAVINSENEARIIKQFVNSKPWIVPGSYSERYNYVSMGFTASVTEWGETTYIGSTHNTVWRTVTGDTLEDAGYTVWQDGQPSFYDHSEFCGSIHRKEGRLNDGPCFAPMPYLCEIQHS